MSSTRADQAIEDVWPGRVMHGYARRQQWRVSRWQGLLGPPAGWGNRPTPGQRVSARDPHMTIVGARTDGLTGVRWPLPLWGRDAAIPRRKHAAIVRQKPQV
jgi:hypothetical protein